MQCIGVTGVNNIAKIRGIVKERFDTYLTSNNIQLKRIFNILSQV